MTNNTGKARQMGIKSRAKQLTYRDFDIIIYDVRGNIPVEQPHVFPHLEGGEFDEDWKIITLEPGATIKGTMDLGKLFVLTTGEYIVRLRRSGHEIPRPPLTAESQQPADGTILVKRGQDKCGITVLTRRNGHGSCLYLYGRRQEWQYVRRVPVAA